MGLRFRFPIVWLPAEHYTPSYNVPDDWWKDFLLSIGYKPLGSYMAEEYDLTQLHVDYIRSNPHLRKWRAALGHAEG